MGDRVWTSPALVDGVIYFGSHDGYLYALEGDEADWRFVTDSLKGGSSPQSHSPPLGESNDPFPRRGKARRGAKTKTSIYGGQSTSSPATRLETPQKRLIENGERVESRQLQTVLFGGVGAMRWRPSLELGGGLTSFAGPATAC